MMTKGPQALRTGVMGLGLAALLWAPDTAASQDMRVQLQANDGSVTITGTFVDLSDGLYTIQTELGPIIIDESFVTCTGPGCPGEDQAVVIDRRIQLISRDGSSEVVGELPTFEDDFYELSTSLGTFWFDTSDVYCFGAACPDVTEANPNFSITAGDVAVEKLLPPLLRAYAEDKGLLYDYEMAANNMPYVRLLDTVDGSIVANIALETAPTFQAFATLVEDPTDIAVVDQALSISAKQLSADEYLIARDALVFITHKDNPVRDLTLGEAGGIWGGAVETWEPLGGGSMPITVHMTREASDTIPAIFTDRVLLANGIDARNLYGIAFHPNEAAVVRVVQGDRHAIGLVNRGAAERGNGSMLEIRKTCGLVSAPTDFDLKVDNYPLERPMLGYAIADAAHPIALDFLEWTGRDTAQLAVSDIGFGCDRLHRMKMRDMGVGIVQTSAASEFDGAQFAAMLRELRDADRLSITFRFQTASSLLDASSANFVRDLANRLRANEFEGLEVLLVGFADSSGGAELNTELAQERAASVRDILLAEFDAQTASRLNIRALSFGEQMPIDCNDTDLGRSNNRRVEVWVRQPA